MARIVDLSLTLREGMRGVEFETARTLQEDGWNARTLKLYSHAGTHMDAPKHFFHNGGTIDAVPLQACIGPARVLDLTFLRPRESITVEHLQPWTDKIAAGDRLLFNTGWSAHVRQDDYRTHFPRLSCALAKSLAQRRIALIGIDTPSVADLSNIDELTEVHRTLLGAGIVIVEELTNLGQLQHEIVQFIALPLKIEGGDSAPVRAIAIEQDSQEHSS